MLWAVSQHPQQRTTQKTEAEVVLWLLIKKNKKKRTCKTSTVSTKWKERALKPRCKYRIITSLCMPRPHSTRRGKRTISPQAGTHLTEEKMKRTFFLLLLCRLGTCYHVKAVNVRPFTNTGLQKQATQNIEC